MPMGEGALRAFPSSLCVARYRFPFSPGDVFLLFTGRPLPMLRPALIALVLAGVPGLMPGTALAAAAASAAAPAASPTAPATKRPLRAEDLFDLEAAADVRIAPDGRRIAYVRRSADIRTDRYRSAIWLIDAQSGAQRPLLDAADRSFSAPRWSPDGTRLLYSRSGGDAPGLYVADLATGAAARIAEEGYAAAWSPDGRSVAFLRFVPGEAPRLSTPPARPDGASWAPPIRLFDTLDVHRDGEGFVTKGATQMFVVPAEGGTPRQVTRADDPTNYAELAWLDGATLLGSGNDRPDAAQDPRESDIFAVSLATGVRTALTRRRGQDSGAAPSPDGRRIAYVGFDDHIVSWQGTDLYVMNRDGSGAHLLTAGLDRAVSDPLWTPDGQHILVTVEKEGRTELMRVGLDGKRTTLATDLGSFGGRPYAGGGFSATRRGPLRVAYAQSATDHPTDVVLLDASGRARRLTDLNSDVLGGIALPTVRKLAVKSRVDGRSIDAWVAVPPTPRPAGGWPTILEIHGGPATMYGPDFATEIQRYAAEGFLTVWSNPRGSTGYGADFALAIDRAFPGQDYDDLMSVADAALAQEGGNARRLFVTGGSAGGAMTAWIVGSTPRFAAAASVNPVINWTSVALAGDTAAHVVRHQLRATPWEDQALYWRHSPLSRVGHVVTPTLMMVGDEDWRAPPFEAEQFYTALKLRGIDAMLARIPESGHSIGVRPSQQIAKTDSIIGWFRRHDPGAAAPAAPSGGIPAPADTAPTAGTPTAPSARP